MPQPDRVPSAASTQVWDWDAIEEGVFRYESDYREGNPRPLSDYLPEGDETLRYAALVELVKVDIELQWVDGRQVKLDDYCQNYGELGSSDRLPPDLVYEAYRVACQHGATDSVDDFCARYPQQLEAVRALARRSSARSTAFTRNRPPASLKAGDRFGDFELLAELGSGAFGKVFLARQVSLARQVALKVTANRGGEARTMAILEHDNIVKVFSEDIEADLDIRLLCMQYVPGTTLGSVIDFLRQNRAQPPSGEAVVQAIDAGAKGPAILQATALKEREQLGAFDYNEAIAWLGACLADAMQHAHEQGVLHRDIKPDNILISQFGRPHLADFNLSVDPHEVGGTAAGMFGGSLPYMSPEHLDAFNPTHEARPDVVDERSDLYSLGIVLYECLALERPFPDPVRTQDSIQMLNEMAAERRQAAPSPRAACLSGGTAPDPGRSLDSVVRRCLEPNPEDRYQTAGELRKALDAARALRGVDTALPQAGRLAELADRRPITSILLAALIPNLLASVVNISYNALRIVSHLSAEQMRVFDLMLLGYNLPVYALCIGILLQRIVPVGRAHVRERTGASVMSPLERSTLRQRLLSFPGWLTGIVFFAWFVGGIAFPLVMHLAAGPLQASVFGHFLIDLSISGLIAVVYSYFFVQAIALRILYPSFLVGQEKPLETAARELRAVPRWLRLAQIGSGVIPLAGATLLIAVGTDQVDSYGMFRLLVTGLIGLGGLGFCLALFLGSYLQRTHSVLVGRS